MSGEYGVGSERPNVLFIMADQMRYDCLGANGNSTIRTPNLDALAERSVNLSSCFVQSPVCVPSRQTFFTGRYPHSHRNRVNYTPMPKDTVLMQRRLQEAGYRTGFAGKLHYYPPTRAYALSTGFDDGAIHDGGPCDEYSDYVAWLRERFPLHASDYRRCRDDRANPFTAAIPDEAHETSWCGRESRAMVRRLAAEPQPWFLFSSYWRPHSPFEVPKPWSSMYDDAQMPVPDWVGDEYLDSLPAPVRAQARRGDAEWARANRALWPWMYRACYGAVSQIDREVGLTLETLDDLGLRDSTIVIFCSDHGDQMLEHGLVDKNVFFESSIHVPLLVSYPGTVSSGRRQDLVESTDLLPTLFELCGVPVPRDCQGRSIAGLITDGAVGSPYERRGFVCCENIIPEVITTGNLDYRYVKGHGVGGIRHPDAKMIRSERWKYNHYVGNVGELFDLAADPGELDNLAGDPAYAGVAASMRDALLDWMITADEPDQISERWLI